MTVGRSRAIRGLRGADIKDRSCFYDALAWGLGRLLGLDRVVTVYGVGE